MGQQSRRKREKNQNFGNGHGPQAAPRNEPRSPREQMDDLLKNLSLSDILGGTLPPGFEPEPPPEPAGPDAGNTYGPGYGASRWNALKLGLRSRVLFPAPMQALIDLRARHFSAQDAHARCSLAGSVSRWPGPVSKWTSRMSC